MKAIRIHEFGGPEVLQLEEIDDPVPGAGEVVVKVHAIGVNPVDAYIRSGAYGERPKPFTPGIDAAGEIESVGTNTVDLETGDRVYIASPITGSYAEKVLVKAENVFRLPGTVSYEAGAGINVPYATAHRALFGKANGKPGETVLVHGASGGVGIAAVQIALDRGFKVIGTAGSAEGEKLVRDQGVEHVFNHHNPNYTDEILQATEGKGPNIILEMLANVNLSKDLDLVAKYGRVVVIGNRGSIEIDPRKIMTKESSVHGLVLFNATPQEVQSIHAALYTGLLNETLRPVVHKTFPLAEAAAAQIAVLEGGSHGKIILVPLIKL